MKKQMGLILTLMSLLWGSTAFGKTQGGTPKVDEILMRELVNIDGKISHRVVVRVKDDDNDEVASLDVTFKPGDINAPKTVSESYKMVFSKAKSTPRRKSYEPVCDLAVLSGICLFNGQKPLGSTYQVTVTMRNIEGKEIYSETKGGTPFYTVTVERSLPKHDQIRFSGTANFVDDWQGETAYIRVKNDRVHHVHSVRVDIMPTGDLVYAPKPIQNQFIANYSPENSKMNENRYAVKQFHFHTNPEGFSYVVTQTLLDASGVAIAEPRKDIITFVNNPKDVVCNTKYKLKEVYSTEFTQRGLYTMAFEINFEKNSDIPHEVEMIVQLKNKNDETMNIKIQLTLNQNTGTYSGGAALQLDPAAQWDLVFGEVGAYNICDELTWWQVMFNAKGNGSGTKNAASQTSAKPQLL